MGSLVFSIIMGVLASSLYLTPIVFLFYRILRFREIYTVKGNLKGLIMTSDFRLSMTFFAGGGLTMLFLYSTGLLEPAVAMRDFYYFKTLGSFVLIEFLCFVVEQLIYSRTKEYKETVMNEVKSDVNLVFLRIGYYIQASYDDKDDKIKDEIKVLMDLTSKRVCDLAYKVEVLQYLKQCLSNINYTDTVDIDLALKKYQRELKLKQLKKDF